MKIEATFKVPGRIYHVLEGAEPPDHARVWLAGDKLFVDGKQVGIAFVEGVDAEPIYAGFQEAPSEWLVHHTTLSGVLNL